MIARSTASQAHETASAIFKGAVASEPEDLYNLTQQPFLIPLRIEFIERKGTMVKTLQFADIDVPTPGFGAMGISFGLGSNLTLEQAEPVLLKAIELGCTFWDTAVR